MYALILVVSNLTLGLGAGEPATLFPSFQACNVAQAKAAKYLLEHAEAMKKDDGIDSAKAVCVRVTATTDVSAKS